MVPTVSRCEIVARRSGDYRLDGERSLPVYPYSISRVGIHIFPTSSYAYASSSTVQHVYVRVVILDLRKGVGFGSDLAAKILFFATREITPA